MPITSANVDRFSKYFHHRTWRRWCNELIIKDPITPCWSCWRRSIVIRIADLGRRTFPILCRTASWTGVTTLWLSRPLLGRPTCVSAADSLQIDVCVRCCQRCVMESSPAARTAFRPRWSKHRQYCLLTRATITFCFSNYVQMWMKFSSSIEIGTISHHGGKISGSDASFCFYTGHSTRPTKYGTQNSNNSITTDSN